MPKSLQKKKLPYNSLDLFNIVIDIEKYPEFIPWCSASRIISTKDNLIIADLMISYKNFNESFRSYVNYDLNKRSIVVEYKDGPLKNLFNSWRFAEINKYETILIFEIEFELKFNLFQNVILKFYKMIENKMIDAFESRAKKILKINYIKDLHSNN